MLLSAFAFCFIAAPPVMATQLSDKAVAPLFKSYKTGCFELLDCETGKYVFRYNPEQCAKRLPPQSTFKIFNSLAGLDCGVLKDANHKMKWDGRKYQMEPWNHDQTLASAMSNSVVWYYQKVAQDIGEERMKKYIQSAHYGNDDISGGITQFWLNNSLKISADEQVDFIRRFYAGDLPFSKRSIDIVKEITELKTTPKGELHGKTGSQGQGDKLVMGWFIGYVVHEGHPYAFATNIEGTDRTWGRKAREITENILVKAGLL